MIYFLILIFFVQIGILIWYLLSYPHVNTKDTLVKISYLSTICMLGGLLFALTIALFHGTSDDRSGYFGISTIGMFFDFDDRWSGFGRFSYLDEFLFGYFITLTVLLLKDISKKLK